MTTSESRNKSLDELNKRLEEIGFTPTGKRIGEGGWGIVDEYHDRNRQTWAIKIYRFNEVSKGQGEHRNLGLDDVILNETIPLSAASHFIVPRIVGNDFVAMPVYECLENRLVVGEPIETRMAFGIARQISHALNHLHTKFGRTHSDLKPANVLMDPDGNALLTDYSASTFASPSRQSKDPRDNIGEICTRAPECFETGSHPDEKSDIYSLGAFFGRLVIGYFPHEKRLANAIDPVREIQNMIELEANARTAEYANKAPAAFYGFIRKCLFHNPLDRYNNLEEAGKGLEKAIIKYEKSKPMSRLKRWGIVAAAALCFGILSEGLGRSIRDRDKLESKLAQQEQTIDFEHKLKIISLYSQNKNSRENVNHQSSTRDDYIEEGKLLGYLQRFKDEKTAFAAYLNPIAVCKAIALSKRENYPELEKTLYGIDPRIPTEIENGFSYSRFPSGPCENGMEDRRNENKRNAVNEFVLLQSDYQRMQELETWEKATLDKSQVDRVPNMTYTADTGLESSHFKSYLKRIGESDKYDELQSLREKFNPRTGGRR